MQRGAAQITVVSPEHYYNLIYDGWSPVTKSGVPGQLGTRSSESAHGVKNFRAMVRFRKGIPGLRVVGGGDALSLAPIVARPNAEVLGKGTQIYDDAHGPLWSDGVDWRNAAHVVVP